MKNIISEVHRMKVLAGLINESNENIKDQVQVWFDLDGVLADMEGSLQKNEELIRLKGELDKVVKEKFSDWAILTNDELKEKFKVAIDAIQSKVPAWGKLGVEDLKKKLAQDPENKDLQDIIKLKELKKAHQNYTNYVFKIAGGNNFYANLTLMPGAVELVQDANKIIGKKSHILTAGLDDKGESEAQKRAWVEEHFGGLVDRVEVTTEKGMFAKSKYDILIDDRTKYVDKFTSAGGSAILYKDASQAAAELQKLYDELMAGN